MGFLMPCSALGKLCRDGSKRADGQQRVLPILSAICQWSFINLAAQSGAPEEPKAGARFRLRDLG